MTPAFRVVANGDDITARIRSCLQSLTVTDEAGLSSDSVSITLADDGIRLPSAGAELGVWLGFSKSMRYMGLYVVDEIALSGPPAAMTIKAAAAPFEASATYKALHDQKSRSWEPQSIQDFVSGIAADHGLRAAVGSTLAAVQLGHIDQTSESDMHLLTRIAGDYDAVSKAAGGALIFVSKGEGRSVTGKELPQVQLAPEEVTTWNATIGARGKYSRVVATWRDRDAAVDREVVSGEGQPTFRLPRSYPTEAAAQAAARARLDAFTRGESSLSCTLPGRPEIIAEARVTLAGFRTGIDGTWSTTRVTHSLTGRGFVTSFEAEVPKN